MNRLPIARWNFRSVLALSIVAGFLAIAVAVLCKCADAFNQFQQ
jgi:hypothetical protein